MIILPPLGHQIGILLRGEGQAAVFEHPQSPRGDLAGDPQVQEDHAIRHVIEEPVVQTAVLPVRFLGRHKGHASLGELAGKDPMQPRHGGRNLQQKYRRARLSRRRRFPVLLHSTLLPCLAAARTATRWCVQQGGLYAQPPGSILIAVPRKVNRHFPRHGQKTRSSRRETGETPTGREHRQTRATNRAHIIAPGPATKTISTAGAGGRFASPTDMRTVRGSHPTFALLSTQLPVAFAARRLYLGPWVQGLRDNPMSGSCSASPSVVAWS